jgi:hypothetical protein
MVSHNDENEEGMACGLNFKPTLSIRQLNDNPDVDKPAPLPILIWHRSATGLYQKGGELDESRF